MQVQFDQLVDREELWGHHDSWKQPYQPAKINMVYKFKPLSRKSIS